MYSKMIIIVLLATFISSSMTAPLTSDAKDTKTFKIKPEDVLGDFNVKANVISNADKVPHSNCKAIYDEDNTKPTGIYTLMTDELRTFNVFCDMKLSGGGWTLIMRRKDAKVNFTRNWNDYKKGFGDLNGDFWIGLENMHVLTKPTSGKFELYVGLQSHDVEFGPITKKDIFKYAYYSTFKIGDASSYYQMTVSGYQGTAGDSLKLHNDAGFSTPDADHDISSSSCAKKFKSGWWFQDCRNANLNGEWTNDGRLKEGSEGIVWETFKGEDHSLKSVIMAIRQVN